MTTQETYNRARDALWSLSDALLDEGRKVEADECQRLAHRVHVLRQARIAVVAPEAARV